MLSKGNVPQKIGRIVIEEESCALSADCQPPGNLHGELMLTLIPRGYVDASAMHCRFVRFLSTFSEIALT